MASASEVLPTVDASRATLRPQGAYIASAGYDLTFFIFAPVLALAVALLLPLFPIAFERTSALGGERMRVEFFIAIWTWAHLAAVFFRSHANGEIFALHRFRFTVVPLVLFISMLTSTWVFITCAVINAFWDVYHTSMQNFGIGRIYDAKIGNDSAKGRSLDIWMNHLVYIGPLVCGLSLSSTIDAFRRYSALGWGEPARWVETITSYQADFRWILIAGGVVYAAYYVFAYRGLIRDGYRVSPQKIMLLVSTGSVSIYAYGFLPPLQALFIANLFHALQYFAIVWWTEKRNISSVLGGSRFRVTPRAALVGFLGIVLLLGIGNEYARHAQVHWMLSLAVLCSILHFWYDGFVWSVRKKQV